MKWFTVIFGMIILGFGCVNSRTSKSRFTNLKCTSFDPSFGEFKICKLQLLRRGVVAANLHYTFTQLPITNIKINFSIFRRYNNYQPFLHNATCDFCHLLAHPNKLKYESLVISAVKSRSNLNHTCPINHDIIMDKLVYSNEFLQKLPLPQGDYMLQLRFMVKKDWRLMVEIFFFNDE